MLFSALLFRDLLVEASPAFLLLPPAFHSLVVRDGARAE